MSLDFSSGELHAADHETHAVIYAIGAAMSARRIIDVHTHVWAYPDHFGDDFRRQAARARAGVEVDLTVDYDHYQATCPPETKRSSSVARQSSAGSGLMI